MNVELLKKSNRIIFECISGSHAYGTNIPSSDFDIRGIYINPSDEYLGLSEPAGQIGDEKHDITYYSLKRFFELAQTANPNILELLWMPQDCIKIKNPIMDELIANRDLFISKKCFHSHSGYAFAQISKAKGSNKKVNNPQSKERPKKEDFCWIIPDRKVINTDLCLTLKKEALEITSQTPARPIPISLFNISLDNFKCAKLEQCRDTYRLYMYDYKTDGVFRGDDMLVPESIPLDDEISKFYGLLVYNKDMFDKAMRDWQSYWTWMENRNESRWIDQEKGKLNYDQKNMCHCVRLLMSGENLLTNGCPLVRFEGEQKDYLMKIRSGEMEYEDIILEVENRMKKLEELYNTSTIQHSVNINKIEELYRKLSVMKG